MKSSTAKKPTDVHVRRQFGGQKNVSFLFSHFPRTSFEVSLSNPAKCIKSNSIVNNLLNDLQRFDAKKIFLSQTNILCLSQTQSGILINDINNLIREIG